MTKKKSKQSKQSENNEMEKNDCLSQKIIFNKKRKISYTSKKEAPIKKIQYPKFICPKCGKPITEIAAALSDKETDLPIHFSCALNILKNIEILNENEELIYIGSGNFAIVKFENQKNKKKFKILKLIEWENTTKTFSWKNDITELVSKI